MDHVYFVNLNPKKRTAKCLVHYTKYTTTPSFIAEICKALSVGNIRRSCTNFAQIASDMAVPENSYVLFDVVVKTAPEVYAFMQAGGCMGFVGNLKEQSECICFENVNVWPLSNDKEENLSLESAQQYFNLTSKFSSPVSQLVSVNP
eukprot:Phypoly_transcript_17140.p1 GENE.Phypoly_transcript_17140~~Phypoly_transcript_17140.p1  ORF type:complete len:147 (+),score=10.30 Phypoly_transcript_17140:58-498(+)